MISNPDEFEGKGDPYTTLIMNLSITMLASLALVTPDTL